MTSRKAPATSCSSSGSSASMMGLPLRWKRARRRKRRRAKSAPSAREPRQQLERIAAFDVHQLRVGKDAAVAQSLDVVDAGSVREVSADIEALFEVWAVS